MKIPKNETDDLYEAVEKHLQRAERGNLVVTETAVENWIRDNAESLQCELGYTLPFIIGKVAKAREARHVTKPVLSFDGGKLELWAYDSDEFCHFQVGGKNGMTCGNDDKAGLVYVEKRHGFNVEEHNLANPGMWEWIQKYMDLGMKAEADIRSHEFKVGPRAGHCEVCDYPKSDPIHQGTLTGAFQIEQDEWQLIVDGILVKASFNSKGAAEAGIEVERARRKKKSFSPSENPGQASSL